MTVRADAGAEAAAAESERLILATGAELLSQGGRALDRLSRPLTIAALVLLLVQPALAGAMPAAVPTVLALVALAGAAETYFALRVGFDAALFRRLAAAGAGVPDLAGLDAALIGMRLLLEAKRGRPALDRVAGARRLLSRQALMLLLQLGLVLAGAVLALLRA